MRTIDAFGALTAAYLLAVIVGAIGWVMNLIAVIHLAAHHAPLDATFVIRIVGVPIAIIGAIMGWL